MAKITFESLSVENFGPFRETQTIDLTVKANKPVILIKAFNGSGKTTLLTALQVGLYGHKALTDLKRSEYDRLITGLKRRDTPGNSVVEISLYVEVGAVCRQLTVRREWFVQAKAVSETVLVSENGIVRTEFSKKWDDFIGSILPAELVQLFLFDGEKIEELANPDRLPILLKSATEVFLGIGGIDALHSDLRALERRAILKNKDTSKAYTEARASLLSWTRQLEELELKSEAIGQEKAAAQNKADSAESSLKRYNIEAQRKGLVAYEQAAEIRSTLMSTRSAMEEARSNLKAAMSDPVLPIAWAQSLWPNYKQAWQLELQAKNAKFMAHEFRSRDTRILKAIEKQISVAALASLRKVFEADLKSVSGAKNFRRTHLAEVSPQDVENQLDQARARVRQSLHLLKIAQAAADVAEQRIGQIPAEEQMSAILLQLQERGKESSVAAANLAFKTKQLEEVHSNILHVKGRLKAAQERIDTEFRDRSMESKSLEASSRARKALSIFKDRVLASKANWLSTVITDEFQKLLRKRNLMTRVIVDPESYQFSILDSQQRELPMERLSAGERQLLATAVLSALIKESKGLFPVVVDTPLARLDQQHRSALIKGFFATVSHQVVVLSTDQEVDGKAYESLQPFNSQEYELRFDDELGRTSAHRICKVMTH